MIPRALFRLGLLAWLCAAVGTRAAAPRPNILFIMTDDHAAHAIGAYGSKINQTPHLDRLGSQGLRLNRCFAVNSICTPSRATILTGQYSHRNGVPVFNNLDPAKVTVAHRLREAGYYTAMLGKWHRPAGLRRLEHPARPGPLR
jgi:arylsulfatase A-like enzyme